MRRNPTTKSGTMGGRFVAGAGGFPPETDSPEEDWAVDADSAVDEDCGATSAGDVTEAWARLSRRRITMLRTATVGASMLT
ncbi:MAG: hypothetical protein L0H22_08190, partial [Brevibacterium aurantiacum]|nr:hypothetical protein [Brevibacterium aurantiacum]